MSLRCNDTRTPQQIELIFDQIPRRRVSSMMMCVGRCWYRAFVVYSMEHEFYGTSDDVFVLSRISGMMAVLLRGTHAHTNVSRYGKNVWEVTCDVICCKEPLNISRSSSCCLSQSMMSPSSLQLKYPLNETGFSFQEHSISPEV